MNTGGYGWLMLAGMFASIVFWSRFARRDLRLFTIYLAALLSAFFGAKVVYLAAEGWLHFHDENRWLVLATGKSILGALLGGYAGVEIAKRLIGYRSPTGDWFAIVVPVGIMFGRIGCIVHGCCLGQICESGAFSVRDAAGLPRWPAAHAEFAFNLIALGAVLLLRTLRSFSGQHFHLYLAAYGIFRLVHEFWRDTPRLFGGISGYQLAALAVALLGGFGFVTRRRASHDASIGQTIMPNAVAE